MTTHQVQLRIVPDLSVECKFWRDDDGWNGRAEGLSITIHASSFERAKQEMQSALGTYIDSVLRDQKCTQGVPPTSTAA